MKRLFFIFCFLGLFSHLIGADSWVEKPDIDFYAHPLVEDFKSVSQFRRGVVRLRGGNKYVEIGGKIYPADCYDEDINLREGSAVVAAVSDGSAQIVGYDRTPVMFFLAAAFAVLVLLLNVKTGLRALIALAGSIAAVFFIFIPAVMAGVAAVPASFVVCAGVTAFTLVVVGVRKDKFLPAFLGATGGIFSALAIAAAFLAAAKTRGFSDENLQLLNYLVRNFNIGLKNADNIYLAGILIGATGVIMDVSISIASSLASIKEEKPDLKPSALFASGMNIGRDIIASMTNSLLFAYVGGAFFLILEKSFFAYSVSQILNAEWFSLIFAEIFAGTSGMILTVPITSFFSSKMLRRK
ncbi:MAG: YibE/F family protein [Elusimicrobia bacterium]|nr:YibE/F family protein [Elusimicrobiota bacterium]